MAKKKKKIESAPVENMALEVQQEEIGAEGIETKEPEIEVEKVEKKPAKKVKAVKQIKEENKSKVDDKKTGKIVQIFNSGMAVVEIGNVKSLVPIGNAKRYRVGDIVQL